MHSFVSKGWCEKRIPGDVDSVFYTHLDIHRWHNRFKIYLEPILILSCILQPLTKSNNFERCAGSFVTAKQQASLKHRHIAHLPCN